MQPILEIKEIIEVTMGGTDYNKDMGISITITWHSEPKKEQSQPLWRGLIAKTHFDFKAESSLSRPMSEMKLKIHIR